MKELSKEDQERIEAAGINLIPTFTIYGNLKADIGSSQRSYAQCELIAFVKGANYEHPIAYNKGYEEGQARKKDDLRDDPAYLASVNNFKVQCEHNNRYYNAGFNDALEEVNGILKKYEITTGNPVFEEIEKLKR